MHTKPHGNGRLAAAGYLIAAALGLLVTGTAAQGQSGFRSPSLEGPGGSTLRSVDGIGLGNAASAASFATRGPSNIATTSSGASFGTGEGGYFATPGSAPGGPTASRFSGGSLLSPISGLSSISTGYDYGGGGAGTPLPLAIGSLRGQTAAVPSYMPFSGSEPLAVPTATADLDADAAVPAEGHIELSEVFQRQIGLRYTRLVDRAWTQFRGGDYQAALHAFRSVEELSRDLMQRESAAARGVNHGMMLAYMADQAYSAAGQQMIVLLRRDPRLFDLSRRAVLENYSNIEEFRRQRLALREHVASGAAEPGTALALCYCVWLDGNAREALDMARSFARQAPPSMAQPYYEFVRLAEARRETAS